jgi:hypothetical protein
VSTIRIPPLLMEEERPPGFREWLAALPEIVSELASGWGLRLDDPYLPGGYCAWVAPAGSSSGEELVLKVDWRGHWEDEHEAAGLTHWDGDGAVRCFAGLAGRMAELAGVDPERVRLWLFARCAQESLDDLTMREPARRLAPT